MTRPHRMTAALVVVLLLVLTGCFRNPLAPGLEEAIPAALLDADLGITDASADKGTSGFTVYVSVGLTVPDGEVTADDLRTILGIVVEHANISNLRYIRLSATDGSADPDDHFEPTPHIDLHTPAEELGIEPGESLIPDAIEVDWDVAVELSSSS